MKTALLVLVSLIFFGYHKSEGTSRSLSDYVLFGCIITTAPLVCHKFLKEDIFIKIPLISCILIYTNITYFLALFFVDETRSARYDVNLPALQLASITTFFYALSLLLFNLSVNIKPYYFKKDPAIVTEYTFVKVLLLSFFIKVISLYLPTDQLFSIIYLFTLSLGIHLFLSKTFKSGPLKVLFIMLVFIELMTRLTSGLLAGVVTFSFLFSFIYLRINKKLPIIPLLFVVITYLLISPIKAEYRKQLGVIEENNYIDKIEVLAVLTSESINLEDNEYNQWNRLSNNIDMLSAVLEQTPQYIPYWNGYTLLSFVYKPIPRFIWPDKPEENLGQEFPRRYGLIDDEDRFTSINLPWFTELYINFGITGMIIGIIIISFVLVFLLKMFSDTNASVGNINYLPGYIILTSLVYQESNLSLMLGGALLSFVCYKLLFKYVID